MPSSRQGEKKYCIDKFRTPEPSGLPQTWRHRPSQRSACRSDKVPLNTDPCIRKHPTPKDLSAPEPSQFETPSSLTPLRFLLILAFDANFSLARRITFSHNGALRLLLATCTLHILCLFSRTGSYNSQSLDELARSSIVLSLFRA